MIASSIELGNLPRTDAAWWDHLHSCVTPYLSDDGWWEQLKADGDRLLIEISDRVTVYNRNGEVRSKTTPSGVMAELNRLVGRGHWVLDGELVGKCLLLFDMVVAGDVITPYDSFGVRYEALEALYDLWAPKPDRVSVLPVARTREAKEALLAEARDQQREGVIFRRVDGHYESRRSRQLMKCKFVREADCIIRDVGVDGHDNVVLNLLDPDANLIRNVGSASAQGKRPRPQPGDVWVVRYLYVVDPERPRLYLPRLIRKRTDKPYDECTYDQISNSFTDKNINLIRDRSNA